MCWLEIQFLPGTRTNSVSVWAQNTIFVLPSIFSHLDICVNGQIKQWRNARDAREAEIENETREMMEVCNKWKCEWLNCHFFISFSIFFFFFPVVCSFISISFFKCSVCVCPCSSDVNGSGDGEYRWLYFCFVLCSTRERYSFLLNPTSLIENYQKIFSFTVYPSILSLLLFFTVISSLCVCVFLFKTGSETSQAFFHFSLAVKRISDGYIPVPSLTFSWCILVSTGLLFFLFYVTHSEAR